MSLDRTFAAVIFDLDGTLVDSSQALYDAWSQWAEAEDVTAEQLADWHGHSSEAIVRALVPPERADASLQHIEQLERDTSVACVALPGAVEAVAAANRHARAAIATSGTQQVASARLRAAGIEPPEVFVTVSDVAHGKPAPDLFAAAADRLGVDPADCLVCEDAPAGVEAARRAGMAVVAVTTTTPAERLAADFVVPDLSAVSFTPDADGVRITQA